MYYMLWAKGCMNIKERELEGIFSVPWTILLHSRNNVINKINKPTSCVTAVNSKPMDNLKVQLWHQWEELTAKQLKESCVGKPECTILYR